jgi:site-specific recombinase XerD
MQLSGYSAGYLSILNSTSSQFVGIALIFNLLHTCYKSCVLNFITIKKTGMKRSNIAILFYLKSNLQDSSLYVRITIDGHRKNLYAGLRLLKSDWDAKRQKAKTRSKLEHVINNHIESFKRNIFETHRLLSDQDVYVSTEMLFQKLTEKPIPAATFISAYNNFLKRRFDLVGIETSKEIYIKHKRVKDKLVNYLKSKDESIESYQLENLDNDFGQGFFNYLRTIDKLSHNTAVKNMQLFKSFIKDAVKRGILKFDPFYDVKIKLKEQQRLYLVENEIQAIAELKDLPERLDLVKDIFLFSCYTGLAYIDIQKLKIENVQIGVDGKKWLFTSRQKTNINSNIPLLTPAEKIIEKYSSTLSTRKGLLPIYSNQKMNAYLKEISTLAKVNKTITFHVARHTFATSITLANGVTIESVSKMLGHKNMRTTQHYAKIVDKRVSEDMNLLQEKFK